MHVFRIIKRRPLWHLFEKKLLVKDNTTPCTAMEKETLVHGTVKIIISFRNHLKNIYFCFFRDTSKEALIEHVREHSKQDGNLDDSKGKKTDNTPDPADLAYRCGHCNQLSNWKHVIQVNLINYTANWLSTELIKRGGCHL